MAASEIEWTEATWNPIAGCTMVSPGCTNCYAMRLAGRLEAMGSTKYQRTTRKSGGRAVWTGRVTFDIVGLGIPLQWRQPKRIFVNSMSDVFQEAVPIDFIKQLWQVMAVAKWHTYQILTKRPERAKEILSNCDFPFLSNVWLGTSVENADYIGRIDLLRQTPAAVRFISFEPLIGPIRDVDLSNIDWAIVGGESGPGARPMEAEWVDELLRACRGQKVAFFFKQWGGRNKKKTGRTLHGRIWDEYPDASRAIL